MQLETMLLHQLLTICQTTRQELDALMSLLVCSLEAHHTYPLILYWYRSFVHWIRPAVGYGANKQMT
jgi:hypothetical protein